MNYVAEFEKLGFNLELNENAMTAKCLKPSKRARLGFTVKFNYYFRTAERMAEFLKDFIENEKKVIEIKETRKLEAKKRKQALVDDVKVGDLFVSTWGFEQTNVDFYEVVEKKGATVTVREIAAARVEGSEYPHGMADEVVPVKGKYIGEPMKKRLNAYGFNINSFASARKTEEGQKQYRSWYA
jgi:hypothetical protein